VDGSEIRRYASEVRAIQERNEVNTPTVSYTRGNDLSASMEGIGGLLARSHGYSGGNFSTHNYYFADGNGNISYMLNTSQAMVASYRYDPFGNTISSSGTLASANVYRFSSKEVHGISGMYYYGYRFYDPNQQRWINRDPFADEAAFQIRDTLLVRKPWEVAEGPNLFVYCFNSPIALADVNGEWTVGIGTSGSFGFGISGGFSFGIYFGHDPTTGKNSWGILQSTAVGIGGPPNFGGGGFIQATTAKRVCELKALGFQGGVTAGEGVYGGADYVAGSSYQGANVNVGVGPKIPAPFEAHAQGTLTSGYDSTRGFRY
jgi:RHS repeat-associated protein